MSKNIFPKAVALARVGDLSREQWLEARRAGVTGSDAAAIAGLSRYRTTFDVYVDKLSPKPIMDNLAMRVGRELEETVARLWSEETGKSLRKSGFMFKNKDREWQLANIDRTVVGENAGLECKTTSSVLNIRKLKGGDFPDEYYAQCVHYMAVTGADRWYLAVLELGFTKVFHTFVIERDEEEIAALTEAEASFWFNNVKTQIAPLPTGSSTTDEYISDMHPDAKEEVCSLYGFEKEIAEFIEIKANIKRLEKSAKGLEQQIKLEMKNASRGVATGYKVIWDNCTRAGGIDIKRLKAEFPEAYMTCVKPDTTYRKFDIKEDK